MQTKLAIYFLLAVTGINAAPHVYPRQSDSIPITIFDSAGCTAGPMPGTTAYVPTDGSCFSISTLLTANTSSGLVDTSLATIPPGCTITVYSNSACNSVNYITLTQAGQCFTFGPGKFISSAKTSGSC